MEKTAIRVVAPAETINLTDYTGARAFANNTTDSNTRMFIRTDAAATRHLDGASYLFCDGHVKWRKPDQMTDTSGPGGNDGNPWSVE